MLPASLSLFPHLISTAGRLPCMLTARRLSSSHASRDVHETCCFRGVSVVRLHVRLHPPPPVVGTRGFTI